MHIIFPTWVYHGTTIDTLESFKEQLINPKYWVTTVGFRKDFGDGFYTTIDQKQAKIWAEKRAKANFSEPCVLKIKCDSSKYKDLIKHHVFLGASEDWAKYILDHRIQACDHDPCIVAGQEHSDVITGPMADGDTGRIVEQFLTRNFSFEWFYGNIIVNKEGTPLSGLELGNQIAFCNPDVAESILTLEGAWLRKPNGEWEYYDKQNL